MRTTKTRIGFTSAALGLVLGLGLPASAAHLTAPALCGVWRVVPSPSPGTQAYLFGVSGATQSDVHAVGNAYSVPSYPSLIERWTGRAWRTDPHPNPGNDSDTLRAVDARTAADVWAVGDWADFNGAPETQPLIEHWNGSRWARMVSLIGGPTANPLYGVTAIAADDAWAVGQKYDFDDHFGYTLGLHWDGSTWTPVSTPIVSGSSQNTLYAVAAVSASDVWAVGSYTDDQTGTTHPLTEHWDGLAWSIVTPEDSGTGNVLFSVSVVGPDDVWAVGTTGASQGSALAEHWDGTSWTIVPTPPVPGATVSYFRGVRAVSSTDVWAVGLHDPYPYSALIEHWDGTSWSLVDSPGAGQLQSVTSVGDGHLWAVGNTNEGTTLIEGDRECR